MGAEADPTENPVEMVSAFTANRGHPEGLIEVEDTAVVSIRFKNGVLGQLLGSTACHPGFQRRILVGGREGSVEIVGDDVETWKFAAAQQGDDAMAAPKGGNGGGGGGAGDPLAGLDTGGFQRNIAAFIEAVRSGAGYLLPGSEMRKSVAVVEAIYASAAANGAPTEVAPA